MNSELTYAIAYINLCILSLSFQKGFYWFEQMVEHIIKNDEDLESLKLV